jgi:hypothetical protein
MRNALLALVALSLGAAACPAQSWADKMFKEGTAHDFGNVPHGSQLYYRFPMTNIYAVPLQIIDVHASCGCITANPSARTLQPRETGYIEVTMDARKFTGAKSVRVNVTVGPEFTSTAELRISATSRADIVFNPGQVTFGVVSRGDTPTQTIDVEYAGALDWRADGVNANGGPFDVTLEELYRRPGQVGYRVKVALQTKAPVGALKQEIYLKTNDPATPLVPVLVEAMVQATLTVSPDPLKLPDMAVGQEVPRKVIVRGSRPFNILAVEGARDGITVATPLPSPQPQVQHTVLLRCQATKPGDVRRQLQIKTDLQAAPVTVTVEGKVLP